jgi:hypothetical protein
VTTKRIRHPWPDDAIADDFNYAVCGEYGGHRDTALVGLGGERLPSITLYEVEEVVRWNVSYHGGSQWAPGDATGTELSLYAVLRLRNGQWASVEAWNDYTGWGCQDGAVVRIGDTEEAVVLQGLSVEGRSTLGYSEPSPVESDGGGD